MKGVQSNIKNHDITIIPSATRTVSFDSVTQTNRYWAGVILYLNISARTVGASPLITLIFAGLDPVSGAFETFWNHGSFDPTVTLRSYFAHPSGTTTTTVTSNWTGKVSMPVPRQWRVSVNFIADVTDLTYSVGGSYVR